MFQPDRSRLVPAARKQWSEMEALIPSPAACKGISGQDEIQTDAVGTESDVTVFWDRKGILLIDLLPRGETVNSDCYSETLRQLRRAIQNKWRGMLTAGVVLLHDNAHPHTARRTTAVFTEFGWELFDDPPYSPYLAHSDFHIFLHLKTFLFSGESFGNDEELKTSVTRWFHLKVAEFYGRGIQKLISRYNKYLNSGGGFVEK
ncbi:mariner Mos1 transposase [Trichonephila clavipes]|nr:mariner Mos1 transposase [Trichonephila clavipes]